MKTNKLFGFIVATVIALLAISTVAAGTLNVNVNSVEANDVVLGSGVTLAGAASETLPVQVQFKANADLQDLRVKVWVEGYKSDVSSSTARFDVLNGSTYVKKVSLALPSVTEMDDVNEGLTLYVSVADKNDEVQNSYQVELQRDSYSLNVLSVDLASKASAGEIIAIDVVLKNTGSREAEDTFVTAAIPELGIAKKAYFGDLTSQDDADADKEDARERRVYLVIPADAKTGDYSVEVKATNYDTTASVRKVISITGLTNATSNSTVTGIAPAANDKEGIPTSIIVLTVVLVIIFVVLLVVLIVLLTKKPSERMEDFGETSYY
jgi:hypothetical protein